MQANARGATGIALGVIAILMGGSKAEAITNQPRAISAGLDYFCLELLVLAMVFVPMERIWSLHVSQDPVAVAVSRHPPFEPADGLAGRIAIAGYQRDRLPHVAAEP